VTGPSSPDRPSRRRLLLTGGLAGAAGVLTLRSCRFGSALERLWEVPRGVSLLGIHGDRIFFQRGPRLGLRPVRGGPEHYFARVPAGTALSGARRTRTGFLVGLFRTGGAGLVINEALTAVWELGMGPPVVWRRTALPWLPEVVAGEFGYRQAAVPPLGAAAGSAAEGAAGAVLGLSAGSALDGARVVGGVPLTGGGAPPPAAPRPVRLLRAAWAGLSEGEVTEVPGDYLGGAVPGLLGQEVCVQVTPTEGPTMLFLPERGEGFPLPARTPGPPIAVGGRLWWLEPADAVPGRTPRPPVLAGCDARGRDYRAWGPLPEYTATFGGAGEVLFWVTRGVGQDRFNLYTLDPAPASRPRHRAGVSGEGLSFLDAEGAYLYFVVSETRERWWDWSPRGLIPQRVQVLVRLRR
jgi:hypothetical protein